MDKTALCDALKSKLDNFRPFPPETLTSLRNYYRVGLTWSSNALEGNSLTESETKVIIEDGLTVQGRPLHDVYEALGHAEAYDYIHAVAVDKDLSVADILKLHELFYKRLNPEQAGKFRRVKVFISGSRYPLPPPEKTAVLMDEFIRWLNENEKNISIKIAGILRLNSDSQTGQMGQVSTVGFLPSLTDKVFEVNGDSDIVNWQKENPTLDPYKGIAYNKNEQESQYKNNMARLGGTKIPNSISIYPKDFDSKDNGYFRRKLGWLYG